MIKIIIGAGIGFAVFYLYQNPGDVTGMIDAMRGVIHSTANTISDFTAK